MLESTNPDLIAHQGSPTKHPDVRLATIDAAGELRIPFTTGILVGIGESEDDRVASLEAIASVHARHGHIQEVILQNYVPHQRYYGREPAEIADAAAADYWRTGISRGPSLELPAWACPITVDDLVRPGRRMSPADAGRRHPGPAEPVGLVAGPDRRRRDRPRRPVGQRRPHLPGAPLPVTSPGPPVAWPPTASP